MCLGLVVLAWQSPGWAGFLAWTALGAIAYGFWLVCTHDGIHHTLTGWVWLDELISRLISWPILWGVGTYSALHRFHHSWNGINLDDPERVQWTLDEYQAAGPIQQWYVRHQWAIDCFGTGSLGLIFNVFQKGWRHRQDQLVRQQLALDVAGMIALHSLLLIAVIRGGAGWRYLVFWLVVERIVGVMMQARDHLEHYGLWQQGINHQVTQLAASRNLATTPLVNWLMGGLPYHALHHAFPQIPFYALPEADRRVREILGEAAPMTCDRGYWRTAIRLSQNPAVIGPQNEQIAIAPPTYSNPIDS
jgi:fatty acid desaturase